jgi:hypothetical protein
LTPEVCNARFIAFFASALAWLALFDVLGIA